MSERKQYLKVFIYLAILTIVEIGVVFLGLPKWLLALCLIVLAGWKALLVAMFFMHLKFETRTLRIIALIPIVLLVFLMFMLLPDSVFG